MERLKMMKECLVNAVEGQIHGNLEKVDTKELGEAIDMIKDLAEAIYYCTITEAMTEDKEEYPKHHGTMYYDPKKSRGHYPKEYDPHHKESHLLRDDYIPYPDYVTKDPQEGRSGERRKMYMEGKGMRDKAQQMKELENYMQELSQDLTEMI
jgi:hypothetical protein